MYTVTIDDHFSAAHSLRNYRGKCEALHGHNWKVKITLAGKKLREGLLFDFTELKKISAQILSELDHTHLNEKVPFFKKNNPTSENIAQYLFFEFKKALSAYRAVSVRKIEVWETERCMASFSETGDE